jgi:hypothetical protein
VVVICPHLIDQMSAFCRCALDPERDHCGIYSELCRGNGWPCFADLGPWGAWRAVAPIMTEMLVYYSDNPEKWDKLTHFALWWYWADAYFDAVGWSP